MTDSMCEGLLDDPLSEEPFALPASFLEAGTVGIRISCCRLVCKEDQKETDRMNFLRMGARQLMPNTEAYAPHRVQGPQWSPALQSYLMDSEECP